MKSAFLARRALVLVLLTACLSPSLKGQVQTIGKWSTMSQTMPINPIHVALLANGKILVVAGSGNCPPSLAGCPTGAPYGPSNHSGALLFDPSAGSFTQFTHELGYVLQCHGAIARRAGFYQWRHHSIRSLFRTAEVFHLRSCHQYLHRRSEHGSWPLVSDHDHARRWPRHDLLRWRRKRQHQQHG